MAAVLIHKRTDGAEFRNSAADADHDGTLDPEECEKLVKGSIIT